MSEHNQVYVIDCGGIVARYKIRYPNLSEDNLHAIVAAGAVHAVDKHYVDPILEYPEYGEPISLRDASVMSNAVAQELKEQLAPVIRDMMHHASDTQCVKTQCTLEGYAVVVTLVLDEEE